MRPGYKTTEFWLAALASLVSLLFASGAIAEGSTTERAIAFIAAALTGLGYSVSRGMAKRGELPVDVDE